MTIKSEHFQVFLAIQMWIDTLIQLSNENNTNSHTQNYQYFISNANSVNNPDLELHVKQCINDFYEYFYVNQHICDINYINTSLININNNYGNNGNKLRLLDLLTNIQNNGQIFIFQTITIYVFQLCCSFREEMNLIIFEDKEKDNSIIKYFTRCS